MDESEKAAFEAVQAEKAELGIPEEPVEAEPEETTQEEPTETESKDEETEEEPDSKEVSNKDEDETELDKVPPKTLKEFKQNLRAEMQSDFDKKLDDLRKEFTKDKPDETATEDLEDDIKKLAEELDFDEDKIRRIIEVARKDTSKLSDEDKSLLEDYKAEKEQREQDEIFRDEWETVLPSLKEKYPNATDDQLKQAREKLDEFAHSEKYHLTDIDYVLHKESEALGKILFSPKKTTFESARPAPVDDSEEFPEFSPNMTPAQFAAFEKKREKMMENIGTEKTKITTRDDRGNIIEREE